MSYFVGGVCSVSRSKSSMCNACTTRSNISGRRTAIRTATTDGIIMLTFTPLEGMSEVVLGFLPAEMRPQDDS